MAVCLPVCQTETTGLTYNTRRVRRADLSAPAVACLSRILGVVAVVVRPLRRECVHPALPAFLRAVWLVHVLPARGMVRVVGEEPATQTFPPLTLFRSGWRARWAEAESEWVGGQGSIPNH